MNGETTSFWKNDRPLRTYPALQQSMDCDVCIIGAGIAGLTTAYFLAKQNKKVVVLDDGPIAGGQTVRTTAHLSNALDDRFEVLEDYFGQEGSKLAAESHRAAIDFVKALVEEYQIACDFELVNAYLFVPPGDDPKILEKELLAAKRAGLDVALLPRAPLKSFDTGPALQFSHQAQFHPLKFLDKLCDILDGLGVNIYCDSHVTDFEEEEVRVGEYHVRAKHIVVATNSPVNSRFFPHLKQAPYRTYVIGGKIPQNSVPAGLYYDTLDPYHYIRVAGDYLLVGGEDHRTAEEQDIEERYKRLETWTRERFPFFQDIAYKWSGQVMEPVDSLAFIGRAHKETYIITGDSGNGLTHGILGAMIVSDQICKKHSPWEKLYDPHRITLKAAPEFLSENVNTALQYKDWFMPGQEEQNPQPGSGIIVQRGVKKCALYKDTEGKVHEMSAVCPHLGALVRWNESEHCWECPAHGSRFDAFGKVIQGPANCDL